MVELPEMAELVHDEIVGELRRQERELVAEIEIAPARTAAPPGALVADAHAAVGEGVRWDQSRIEAGKMLEPRMRNSAGGFFMQGESTAACERGWATSATRVPTDTAHDSPKRIDPYSPPDNPEEWHCGYYLIKLSYRACITSLDFLYLYCFGITHRSRQVPSDDFEKARAMPRVFLLFGQSPPYRGWLFAAGIFLCVPYESDAT